MSQLPTLQLLALVLGIFCLLLIIYVVVPIIQLMLFSHASQTKYYAEFQSYKDNFVLIKDFIMEKYPDSWNTCLSVDIMEDGWYHVVKRPL